MSNPKVQPVNLPHGVRLRIEDGGYHLDSARDNLQPYTVHLLDPVDGIDAIEVAPATLGDILTLNKRAQIDSIPGTKAFREAIMRLSIADRCDPAITPEQVKSMAGVDYDLLQSVIETGRDPNTGSMLFTIDDPSLERRAFVRLHSMTDRRKAEQRLTTSQEDEPVRYEAYLTWLVTTFGDPNRVVEHAAPGFEDFLKISWQDFQALNRALASRDYKPLTDILDGMVKVDGKPVPFQGVPGDDAAAHQAGDGRGETQP